MRLEVGTFPYHLGNGYAMHRTEMRFVYEGELHKHRGLLTAGVRLAWIKRARIPPPATILPHLPPVTMAVALLLM